MPLPITVYLDRAQARRRHPCVCGSYPTTLRANRKAEGNTRADVAQSGELPWRPPRRHPHPPIAYCQGSGVAPRPERPGSEFPSHGRDRIPCGRHAGSGADCWPQPPEVGPEKVQDTLAVGAVARSEVHPSWCGKRTLRCRSVRPASLMRAIDTRGNEYAMNCKRAARKTATGALESSKGHPGCCKSIPKFGYGYRLPLVFPLQIAIK
jgi:hypothetical protein